MKSIGSSYVTQKEPHTLGKHPEFGTRLVYLDKTRDAALDWQRCVLTTDQITDVSEIHLRGWGIVTPSVTGVPLKLTIKDRGGPDWSGSNLASSTVLSSGSLSTSEFTVMLPVDEGWMASPMTLAIYQYSNGKMPYNIQFRITTLDDTLVTWERFWFWMECKKISFF